MRVRDIMTEGVYSLNPDVNLEYAATIMRDKDLGVMPVTNQGRLLGILTDRDILTRAVASGDNLKTTRAADVMTSNIVSVLPDQSIIEASKLMAKNKVRRLPVCENNRLLGIISLCDIARVQGLNFEAAAAISDISSKN